MSTTVGLRFARTAERHVELLARGSGAEKVVAATVAASWVLLGLHETTGGGHPHGAGAVIGESLRAWLPMIGAMMGPAMLPAVRHVADSSLPWRRGRAVTTFVGAFAVVWMAYGILAVGAASLVPPWPLLAPVALAAAALWQLTPHKRRYLRDCHRAVPLPPRGWRATAGCLRFGLVHGAACVGTCWGLMAFMALLPRSHLPWSLLLTAVVLVERNAAKPNETARRVAVILTALAALAAVAALR